MGSKSTDTPDYTPVSEASNYAADLSYRLGQDQIQFYKDAYNDLAPLYKDITETQIAVQDESLKQGREYYDYLKNTYWPLEQQLVADAQSYNTEAKREELAQQAAADVARANTTQRQSTARTMASMGINPNSGRFAGQQRQSDLAMASQRANAMTEARTQAEATGYARKLDAASLGRNLSGASTGAYSLAVNAGNSAASNAYTPTTQTGSGMASGISTIQSGLNTQMSGLTSVLGTQSSVYNAQSNENSALWSGLGEAGGTLLGWKLFK